MRGQETSARDAPALFGWPDVIAPHEGSGEAQDRGMSPKDARDRSP